MDDPQRIYWETRIMRLGTITATVCSLLFTTLQSVPAYADATLNSPRAVGVAAFDKVYQVVISPRCRNCHTSVGEGPVIGDDRSPHPFLVIDHKQLNAVGMSCNSCHAPRRIGHSARPPHTTTINEWREPGGLVVGTVGKGLFELPKGTVDELRANRAAKAEVCAKMAAVAQAWNDAPDSERSLFKGSPKPFVDFITKDQLIAQAWHPGAGRSAPPDSRTVFIEQATLWYDNGRPCPQQ